MQMIINDCFKAFSTSFKNFTALKLRHRTFTVNWIRNPLAFGSKWPPVRVSSELAADQLSEKFK